MKRFTLIIGGVLLIALVVIPPFLLTKNSSANDDVVTRTGLHWHPHLTIVIKGKNVEIPRNVGRLGAEQAIHTHDEDDLIHLEFPGVVYKADTTLDQFFKIWGKTFNHDCVLEFCNGTEGKLSMTVNNQPNLEYENYPMRDGDQIVLKFE